MTSYVLGFMFNHDATHVVLIKKNKPAFMAGLLNGVGGKIEIDETPCEAMRREFEEEAGFSVTWQPLTSLMVNDKDVMFVFSCFSNLYHNAKQMEEEEIVKLPLELVGTEGLECMDNIHGFIQQALQNR